MTSIRKFFSRLYDIITHDFVDEKHVSGTGKIKDEVEKNLQSVDEVNKSADHLRELARGAYHRLKNAEMVMSRTEMIKGSRRDS